MPSPPPGPAELCVGDCSADFRTQSEQLYSFVVREMPVPYPRLLLSTPPAAPQGCFSHRRQRLTA